MKILACVYACLDGPDQRFHEEGEGLLGWNIIQQISTDHTVHVLTHAQNRELIETRLLQEPIPMVTFYYLSLPSWLDFLRRFHGGIQLYTYLWQIKAYFVSKKLHTANHFDLFHHITYANDWMASFIGALLPVPYIRGPGGSSPLIPEHFLQQYSWKNRFKEGLRWYGQKILRQDPFFILGQNRARALLVCNAEALAKIPKALQYKAVLFPVTGISSKELKMLSGKKASVHQFTIMIAGRLVKAKGFDLAIEAFRVFCNEYPESQLLVVGDGPDQGYLKNLAMKLGFEKEVIFKPWMDHQALLLQMASCDVFLFPSLRDGGGAVVVEAMAVGLPVICLDIGGPGFHIQKEWGIKIKPQSREQVVVEMAQALKFLAANPGLRTSLGLHAKKRAKEFYLWETLGNKLKEIYNTI